MDAKLTPHQLEILQHALGLDQYGRMPRGHSEPYRNFFCAGEDDEDTCRGLVELGLMKQHRTTELYPYYNCSVTESGKKAVREQSPAPPKLSRSKQRYLRWLDVADCFPDWKFGDWLKNEKRLRENAEF